LGDYPVKPLPSWQCFDRDVLAFHCVELRSTRRRQRQRPHRNRNSDEQRERCETEDPPTSSPRIGFVPRDRPESGQNRRAFARRGIAPLAVCEPQLATVVQLEVVEGAGIPFQSRRLLPTRRANARLFWPDSGRSLGTPSTTSSCTTVAN
jgi:hypothetical protein